MTAWSKIWWGEDRIRMGWFIELDGKTKWIHGPSICMSSGGGPVKAIQKAKKDYGNIGRIEIEVPSHNDIDGQPCRQCQEAVDRVLKIENYAFTITPRPIFIISSAY